MHQSWSRETGYVTISFKTFTTKVFPNLKKPQNKYVDYIIYLCPDDTGLTKSSIILHQNALAWKSECVPLSCLLTIHWIRRETQREADIPSVDTTKRQNTRMCKMSYKHTNAAVASTPLHHCNKPNTIFRYLYLKANWAKKVVTQQQERLHHCVTSRAQITYNVPALVFWHRASAHHLNSEWWTPPLIMQTKG